MKYGKPELRKKIAPPDEVLEFAVENGYNSQWVNVGLFTILTVKLSIFAYGLIPSDSTGSFGIVLISIMMMHIGMSWNMSAFDEALIKYVEKGHDNKDG